MRDYSKNSRRYVTRDIRAYQEGGEVDDDAPPAAPLPSPLPPLDEAGAPQAGPGRVGPALRRGPPLPRPPAAAPLQTRPVARGAARGPAPAQDDDQPPPSTVSGFHYKADDKIPGKYTYVDDQKRPDPMDTLAPMSPVLGQPAVAGSPTGFARGGPVRRK